MNLFWHLVGLLRRGVSPTQGLDLHRTTQHIKTQTHIHAPSGIRTRYPSVRAVEDSTCVMYIKSSGNTSVDYSGTVHRLFMDFKKSMTGGKCNAQPSHCIWYNHETSCLFHGLGPLAYSDSEFNWAPRHEGVLGEWRYRSTHSLTSALDGGEWSASRPGRFTPRERAPLDRRLGGPQSRSGCGGEEKNSDPPPGIEP
jgi:hypothetical protein